MESFIIEGGHPLKGSIKPQGAKNEALQILCATLLTSEPIIVNNIPNILDVNKLIQILTNLGVEIEKKICLYQISMPVPIPRLTISFSSDTNTETRYE